MHYVTRGLMETALTEKLDSEFVHKEAVDFCMMMREKFTKPEYLEE